MAWASKGLNGGSKTFIIVETGERGHDVTHLLYVEVCTLGYCNLIWRFLSLHHRKLV